MNEAPIRAGIRAGFASQADWCRRLGAPFTARVCDMLGQIIDRSTATGRRVLDWTGDPVADALPLRLAGGLNARVRSGGLPELAALYPPHDHGGGGALETALAAALADPRLLPWLDSAPQTNEVARSAVLVAGLLVVAEATGLPLALFELGASAGLNLRLDHYAYRLGTLDLAPPGAPLTLAPTWDGPPPPPATIRVVGRRGVDLNPVDLTIAAARDRLLAYVWPEQRERVARLEQAIAAFVADPVALDRDDAADWTEAEVAPTDGVATVVFHSIAFQYFPDATKARVAAHLEAAGAAATADAPLAWLRYEFDGDTLPTLRLRLWPGGDDRLLAHAHPHGATIQWLA